MDESRISEFFQIYHMEVEDDSIRYHVIPMVNLRDESLHLFFQELSADYDVSLYTKHGEFILEIKKRKERYWINIVLFILTFLSVAFTGSMFYGNLNILQGIEFAIAVMFVLGSHEMGHYMASKRWRMKASLPYFIPFPTIIGTLGAIIKQRGVIKSRRALLEIGISGPIAGLVASVAVTYYGLKLTPPEPAGAGGGIVLGEPPLFGIIAKLAGFDGFYIHPVAFAGWVGMFVTALNLIPVGQLDGGHAMRALIGEKADVVSRIFPLILIGIGFLYRGSGVWFFWGLVTLFFSMQRHPKPSDDSPLPVKYKVAGVITFILGVLCFTPVPFQISEGL